MGFAAAHLADNHAIGTMSKRGLKQIADRDGWQIALRAPRLEPDDFRLVDCSSALSSMIKIRSVTGRKALLKTFWPGIDRGTDLVEDDFATRPAWINHLP